MAHQKTFYQISRVVIADIRYGIVNSSDSSHCKVVIGSQKWGSSKQEEENGAANGPQIWTMFAIREEGRGKQEIYLFGFTLSLASISGDM
jgi:hypothetical protein